MVLIIIIVKMMRFFTISEINLIVTDFIKISIPAFMSIVIITKGKAFNIFVTWLILRETVNREENNKP